jgi:saccharopine dehydrogenase (NAD+, L-lysine-forming)
MITTKKSPTFPIGNTLYIRNESNLYEFRTPIVPADIPKLLDIGWYVVYVESSSTRAFSDDEYELAGAVITYKPWYHSKYKDACIIGLKDIELNRLNKHTHLYFSHSYKKQLHYEKILGAFKSSESILYDFEYLFDMHKKRAISFGYYAGICGCILGLRQYVNKRKFGSNIRNISYWNSKEEIVDRICSHYGEFNNTKIVVIGHQGKCGSGVCSILNSIGLTYKTMNRNDDKRRIIEYDVVFNCIVLDENSNEVWITESTPFTKPVLIVDISCDYSKSNNPISVYSKETTWKEPVFSVNEFVDIIAVNNLPALLPVESSEYFSNTLVKLMNGDDFKNKRIWENNKRLFLEKISTILVFEGTDTDTDTDTKSTTELDTDSNIYFSLYSDKDTEKYCI